MINLVMLCPLNFQFNFEPPIFQKVTIIRKKVSPTIESSIDYVHTNFSLFIVRNMIIIYNFIVCLDGVIRPSIKILLTEEKSLSSTRSKVDRVWNLFLSKMLCPCVLPFCYIGFLVSESGVKRWLSLLSVLLRVELVKLSALILPLMVRNASAWPFSTSWLPRESWLFNFNLCFAAWFLPSSWSEL